MIETERLIVRPVEEADRDRFVELFSDPAFNVFGNPEAPDPHRRFDGMLDLAAVLPYAKQPIVERSSGAIVGYTGVGLDQLFGVDRQEWGWRLVPEARGRGYATEAGLALLAVADRHVDGEVVCIIDRENRPSRRVAEKLGFEHWCEYRWEGDPARYELLVRSIGRGGPVLVNPLGDSR